MNVNKDVLITINEEKIKKKKKKLYILISQTILQWRSHVLKSFMLMLKKLSK